MQSRGRILALFPVYRFFRNCARMIAITAVSSPGAAQTRGGFRGIGTYTTGDRFLPRNMGFTHPPNPPDLPDPPNPPNPPSDT